MEAIKQYDRVLIRPGDYRALSSEMVKLEREQVGTVVEAFGGQDLFMVDIDIATTKGDCIDVRREDITRIL